jgi:hypothetical protein
MAQGREALAKLIKQRKWQEAHGRPDRAVWTDDYSNLLGVLKWEGEER